MRTPMLSATVLIIIRVEISRAQRITKMNPIWASKKRAFAETGPWMIPLRALCSTTTPSFRALQRRCRGWARMGHWARLMDTPKPHSSLLQQVWLTPWPARRTPPWCIRFSWGRVPMRRPRAPRSEARPGWTAPSSAIRSNGVEWWVLGSSVEVEASMGSAHSQEGAWRHSLIITRRRAIQLEQWIMPALLFRAALPWADRIQMETRKWASPSIQPSQA